MNSNIIAIVNQKGGVGRCGQRAGPCAGAIPSCHGFRAASSDVGKVREQINPKLKIDGILLTMADNRTNYAKEIASLLRETYGAKLRGFDTVIPHSVRAAEIAAEGRSIYAHGPKGKAAQADKSLTKEVLQIESNRQKHRSEQLR